MIPTARRVSKQIMVGDVKVGGDAPVVVQSMCSTDTSDVKATVAPAPRARRRRLRDRARRRARQGSGRGLARDRPPDAGAPDRRHPLRLPLGARRDSRPASTAFASIPATSVTPTRCKRSSARRRSATSRSASASTPARCRRSARSPTASCRQPDVGPHGRCRALGDQASSKRWTSTTSRSR